MATDPETEDQGKDSLTADETVEKGQSQRLERVSEQVCFITLARSLCFCKQGIQGTIHKHELWSTGLSCFDKQDSCRGEERQSEPWSGT